jgi:hypothetical protein
MPTSSSQRAATEIGADVVFRDGSKIVAGAIILATVIAV